MLQDGGSNVTKVLQQYDRRLIKVYNGNKGLHPLN